MDEECLRPGEPTDMSFLEKLNFNLNSHPHFISHMKADIQTQKIMGRDVSIFLSSFKNTIKNSMKNLFPTGI